MLIGLVSKSNYHNISGAIASRWIPHIPRRPYAYHGAVEVIQAYVSPEGKSPRRSLLPPLSSRLLSNFVSDGYLDGMAAIEYSRRGLLVTWLLGIYSRIATKVIFPGMRLLYSDD